jgi:hypothetical protein
MARRIVNRKEKRAEVEAFERQKEGEEREEDDEEEEDEDDDEEGDDEEEGEADDEEGEADDEEGEADDEDDEDAPKKKKKAKAKKAKAPKVVKPKAKPRSRAAKVTRMRVVWGVFNNSHQMVASYEYPKKQDAEAHAAKLMADKRSTHFVQPVKEPMAEEKKEK